MITTDCSLRVKNIISEKLGLQVAALSNELSFQKDLGVDSLDFCEVVWAVEKNFKLSIPDEEMENIDTVGQLINYVDQRVAA
jgi:acyl carrier protein